MTDKRDEACIVRGHHCSVFVFSCRIHFSVVVDNNTAFQKVGKKEKWRLAPWSANDVIAATAVNVLLRLSYACRQRIKI